VRATLFFRVPQAAGECRGRAPPLHAGTGSISTDAIGRRKAAKNAHRHRSGSAFARLYVASALFVKRLGGIVDVSFLAHAALLDSLKQLRPGDAVLLVGDRALTVQLLELGELRFNVAGVIGRHRLHRDRSRCSAGCRSRSGWRRRWLRYRRRWFVGIIPSHGYHRRGAAASAQARNGESYTVAITRRSGAQETDSAALPGCPPFQMTPMLRAHCASVNLFVSTVGSVTSHRRANCRSPLHKRSHPSATDSAPTVTARHAPVTLVHPSRRVPPPPAIADASTDAAGQRSVIVVAPSVVVRAPSAVVRAPSVVVVAPSVVVVAPSAVVVAPSEVWCAGTNLSGARSGERLSSENRHRGATGMWANRKPIPNATQSRGAERMD